ncbi:MAG: HpcH/HpaI aldolase/citrate lyase family protein [Acidimicrobiia bacterium]
MLENTTMAKLAAGETVLGAFFKYPEPTLAEYIAMQGWDFIIFDGEHGSLQPRDVEGLCRATELRGVTPIVRATTNEAHVILRFLDAGPHGVHIPWVNTPEAVEQAVRAVKYGPRGQRGLAGSRASEWGLNESIGDYTVRANRETLVIIHIETAAAVDAIESYVEIDGVDVLFIGPTDLSHSLGHPGVLDHPDVVAALDRVTEVVVPSSKTLGIFAGNESIAAQWIGRGARYIATGSDAFLGKGMKAYLDHLRT